MTTESHKTYTNEIVQARLERATGVATLTLAMPGRANKINEAFGRGLAEALEWALGQPRLEGIVLATAHKDFCVGADIDGLYVETEPARMFAFVTELGRIFRKLETAGVPVAAALTGSALGGGYELALSCHHRVALDSPRVQVGLPEVTLGVIPGAGGTQRLPRLIGIQPALERLLAGALVRAPKAKKLGMVDDLQPTPEAVLEAARAWVLAHPKARQPWDERGFRYPGAQPDTEQGWTLFIGAAAMLFKKTSGAMRAPEVLLQAVQDGAALAFDRALEVEARLFAALAVGPQAKDMMRTMWYFRQAALKAKGLPHAADHGFRKVAVLGAGMMGAGLAFVAARKGFDVVLRDISQEQLDRGVAHCKEQAAKGMRHASEDERQTVFARIHATLDLEDVRGANLVIEAVVENDRVKHAVIAETEPLLAAAPVADGSARAPVVASNTSAIPITHLAEASKAPDRFVGMHFFSPVEKMPLIEIIAGAETSEETLGRAVAFGLALGKLPIVVNDGFGFYTSRTFAAYLLEAVELLAEGHDPVVIEWAARSAGMAVPPLQVFDEVTLGLGLKALTERETFTGEPLKSAGLDLLRALVREHDRAGRAAGRGFYDYEAGRRVGLWPGLADLVRAEGLTQQAGQETGRDTGLGAVQRRLMFSQVLEAARCMDEGVLRRAADAEVGGVFGIGFSPGAGGPLAWIDRYGAARLVDDLRALDEALPGPRRGRWAPPKLLVEMAAQGHTFFGPEAPSL